LLAHVQVVELPDGAATYHCSTPRLMPLTSIDPSLAIGFYCSNAGGCKGFDCCPWLLTVCF
jgi:hypothetical protein